MPTLRRRGDGGFYIRRKVGTFITYQVRPEAIKILRTHGVDEQNNFVPPWLFETLHAQGLIYTHGSGLSEPPTAPDKSAESNQLQSLSLCFSEDGDPWDLLLVIPSLPPGVLKNYSSGDLEAILETCYLRVGNTTLSALKLWPNTGEVAESVPPNESSYAAVPEGDWPASLDLSPWENGIDGLKQSGTVFADETRGGFRLSTGEPLYPGRAYYLVASSNSPNDVRPPVELCPQYLGDREGWRAWRIEIPVEISDSVRNWCTEIGHPLVPGSWDLRVVSPPAIRYRINGTAIFATGSEVVIEAVPPGWGDAAREPVKVTVSYEDITSKHISLFPGNPRYIRVPVHSAGTYRVRLGESDRIVLTFLGAEADTQYSEESIAYNPEPLLVTITSTGGSVTVDALQNGYGPHEILVDYKESDFPSISASCLVPVDVKWSVGGKRGHKKSVLPSDLPVYLENMLPWNLAARYPLILTIDGGTFGALSLYVLPKNTTTCTLQSRELPIFLRDQLRWVTFLILASHRRGSCTVALPRELRDVLTSLVICPELSALARVGTVPPHVVPRLTYLATQLKYWYKNSGGHPCRGD